jgi:hypothetical protein
MDCSTVVDILWLTEAFGGARSGKFYIFKNKKKGEK